MAHQIRPLDPLASQIGEHDSDLKYIQEVLYYLDSRMRAALSFLNNVQNDPLVAEFILTGIAVELEFALGHAAAAVILMMPFDLPILSRLLATDIFLHRYRYDDIVLSPALRLQLDASLDSDHPASMVYSYYQDWWTTPNPEEKDYACISNANIQDALEYHRQQKRRTARVPIDHTVPLPSGANAMNDIRNHADGYRNIFQSRIQFSGRRAAGFFMLGEAAAQKADNLAIPAFDEQQKMSPDGLRLNAVDAAIKLMELPPATRNLGIRLTLAEAMEVFTPREGTRSQDRTKHLPAGSLDGRWSPQIPPDDPHPGDTFSVISQYASSPTELATGDIPTHFQDAPLRNFGVFGPPFRTLGHATDPELSRALNIPHSHKTEEFARGERQERVSQWLRAPPRHSRDLASAGVKFSPADLIAPPVPHVPGPSRDLMDLDLSQPGANVENQLDRRFMWKELTAGSPPSNVQAVGRPEVVAVSERTLKSRFLLGDLNVDPDLCGSPVLASTSGADTSYASTLLPASRPVPTTSEHDIHTTPNGALNRCFSFGGSDPVAPISLDAGAVVDHAPDISRIMFGELSQFGHRTTSPRSLPEPLDQRIPPPEVPPVFRYEFGRSAGTVANVSDTKEIVSDDRFSFGDVRDLNGNGPLSSDSGDQMEIISRPFAFCTLPPLAVRDAADQHHEAPSSTPSSGSAGHSSIGRTAEHPADVGFDEDDRDEDSEEYDNEANIRDNDVQERPRGSYTPFSFAHIPDAALN